MCGIVGHIENVLSTAFWVKDPEDFGGSVNVSVLDFVFVLFLDDFHC